MPLVSKILEAGLLRVFKAQKGLSASDAAKKWAKAYADYAQMALAGGIPAVLTGAEAQGLESKLASVLSSPKTATASSIALAWATGVLGFWSSPPVSFGPGKVAVAAGAMSAVTPLTAVFSNTKNTPEACAAQMASALDTATKTVIVLLPVPPPPHPAPLT